MEIVPLVIVVFVFLGLGYAYWDRGGMGYTNRDGYIGTCELPIENYTPEWEEKDTYNAPRSQKNISTPCSCTLCDAATSRCYLGCPKNKCGGAVGKPSECGCNGDKMKGGCSMKKNNPICGCGK